MSQKENVDINEAFDSLLLAEDIAAKAAYEEGYEQGKNQLVDGYHLGYHRASLLAAQLGYYSGVLEQYLQTNKTIPEKVSNLGKKLMQDIIDFPRTNVETVDIIKSMEDIKFNYAKFCSLAKLNSAYPETDKLDF